MAYTNYSTPKGDPISRLLWRLAGAERYLLERGTLSDQVKWACMGGIVLSTALMAAFAGGYAFYTIFKPVAPLNPTDVSKSMTEGLDATAQAVVENMPLPSAILDETHMPTVLMAIVFGIIWGLIILNIDRFIVAATGKGDGKETISRGEILSALPRLFMATVIAVTISKPMEIRIFKAEIDMELFKHQQAEKDSLIAEMNARYGANEIAIKQRIEALDRDIAKRQDRVDELQDQYVEEARIIRPGPRAEAVERQLEGAKKDLDQIKRVNQPKIDALYQELKDASLKKDAEVRVIVAKVNMLDGLLERIKLAHKVAGWEISLFIFLLFWVIEVTPIFFKMMLIKGPYDYMEENLKAIVLARQGVHIRYNTLLGKDGQEVDEVNYYFVDAEAEITKREAEKYERDTIQDLERTGPGKSGGTHGAAASGGTDLPGRA